MIGRCPFDCFMGLFLGFCKSLFYVFSVCEQYNIVQRRCDYRERLEFILQTTSANDSRLPVILETMGLP